VTQDVPAQAVHADEAQAVREQAYARAQAAAVAAGRAEAQSEIPTAQDRATFANSQAGSSQAGSQTPSASLSDADGDIAIPGPALHADQAEQIREQAYNKDE
jgi:hypothetical protein